MSKIIKQFTKFIFPFHFVPSQISPESAQSVSKKGAILNVWEPYTQSCESLREGLELLLDKDGGATKIADCYQLNINCRRAFDLPARKTDRLEFHARQAGSEPLKVSLPEVKVYFFESRVGFVELEFVYESDSLDDYLNLNYFICEAKSDKNYFVAEEKVWDEETKSTHIERHTFSVQSLLERIFDSVSGSHENTITFSYSSAKPLVYSHLLVDERPADLDKLLSHLAKNYKGSYKFDDSCTAVKVLHPFENSYWATSLCGAVNISFLTGDPLTDEFFSANFYTKTRDTYFFLFLNVLHGRHAIMHITARMGKLDRLVHDYYVMEKQLRLARQYSAEAANLKFRAFFRCPSTVEHVNDYYNMLYSAFQVSDLYNNFTTDIKSLQDVCQSYVDRIHQREEKFKKRKAAKIEIAVSLFGFIVGEITLFNNSWTLIEKVLGHSLSFWSPAILILFGTLLSPLISILLNVKKQMNEVSHLTKQINTEEDNDLVEDDRERYEKGKRLERYQRNRRKAKQLRSRKKDRQ